MEGSYVAGIMSAVLVNFNCQLDIAQTQLEEGP